MYSGKFSVHEYFFLRIFSTWLRVISLKAKIPPKAHMHANIDASFAFRDVTLVCQKGGLWNKSQYVSWYIFSTRTLVP